MPNDLLVKLYDLPDYSDLFARVKKDGYRICRPLSCDKSAVLKAVSAAFPGWEGECEAAFSRETPTLYIAVQNNQPVGFACYHATAKDYFGPVGVLPEHRGHAIGVALLASCLQAMAAEGYGYAIIGWTELSDYYAKACGAIPIPDSFPGIYSRLISAPDRQPEKAGI